MLEKLQFMAVMLINDVKSVRRDERGATATEYALLVAFIAFAIIVGATVFGSAVSGYFDRLGGIIDGWGTASPE